MIPAHLQQLGAAKHYFGTLSPMRRGNDVAYWLIKGEPAVVEFAKRLFPGSVVRYAGEAIFGNTKRIVEDLNWLMIRYPLEITDEAAWQESKQKAIDHSIRITQFNERPDKVLAPPEFKGELREFQKEGLSFLMAADRTLLADEMGLGKTIEALACVAAKKAYPALIVVPPHLVKNWQHEIEKFIELPSEGQLRIGQTNPDRAVHVIKGLKPYVLPPASVYIIHYLILRGWKNELPEYNFKAVIFDEIQELRHGSTEKYSAASLLSGSVPTCYGLSGTPIYNRGGEIWHVMNILEYHCLGDYDSFTREWCTGYGSDTVRNPDVLGAYLRREGLMLRRTKEQVLQELPPKRRVVQVVDFDKGQYGELIQSAVEKAQIIDGVKDYFERGRLTREIINDSRMAMGLAKAPYVTAFVKMLLDAGESVLLFAYHHAVFDLYLEELKEYNPVEITGRETVTEKDQSVRSFMEGKTNICMISLRAAAGLNLQRATCVVFGELDWSPAIHSQAEDRAHRIGQKDSVLCYYLVAEEGSDEVIQEFLGLKVSQFVGIMGDRTETEEEKVLAQEAATNHMSKIIAQLKTKGGRPHENHNSKSA